MMLHLSSPTRPTLTSPLLAQRSPSPLPDTPHSLRGHTSGSLILPSPAHLAPPPTSPTRPRSLPALNARPPLPPLFGLSVPRTPSPNPSADPDPFSTDDDTPLPSPLPPYRPSYYHAVSPTPTPPALSPSRPTHPVLASRLIPPEFTPVQPTPLVPSQTRSDSTRSAPFAQHQAPTRHEATAPPPHLNHTPNLPTDQPTPFPSPSATRVNTPPTPAKLADTPMNTTQADGLSASETAHLTQDRSAMQQRYDIQYSPERAGRRPSRVGNVFLYILAILLPPVPVFLKAGCGCDFLVNILLWALCWIPGVIHSMYIIATRP